MGVEWRVVPRFEAEILVDSLNRYRLPKAWVAPMRKVVLITVLLSLRAAGWAQAGCEISNTGADTGIATVSATENMGYSAPGGVGAVGFRIPVACITGSIGYHVWRVDTSSSSAPATYDIGLYCVSGDCATGNYGGDLYVHTGPIPGSWFTNNRISTTVTGVSVTGSATTLTVTGFFLLPDFPLGETITLGNCGAYSVAVVVNSASTTSITANNPTSQQTTISHCTVLTSATYPTGFGKAHTCTDGAVAKICQEALPWVADNRTVCTSIPCTLPAGLYGAAIGTTCSDARKPVTCAQLLGDADLGLIYPFTASSTHYDAGGLPPNMSFTVNSTTAIWNTTQGPSAPIKPVKFLIY